MNLESNPNERDLQIACSTVTWFFNGERDLQKILEEIQAAGYTAVELFTSQNKNPAQPFGDLTTKIKNVTTSIGLEIISINAFLPNRGERIVKDPSILRHLVEYTNALDCKKMMIIPYSIDRQKEEVKKHLVALARTLEKLEKYAASHKVKLTVHHCVGSILENIEEINFFFEKSKIKTIGLTLDTGHFVATREDPIRALKTYHQMGILDHIHLKDAIAGNYEGFDLGDGAVDFPNFIQTLKKIDYRGGIVVEIAKFPHGETPFESAQRNRAYVEKLLSS
jgi:sugar phosphate isomerase/epimerase